MCTEMHTEVFESEVTCWNLLQNISAEKKTGKSNMAKYEQLLSDGYVRIHYYLFCYICLNYFYNKKYFKLD